MLVRWIYDFNQLLLSTDLVAPWGMECVSPFFCNGGISIYSFVYWPRMKLLEAKSSSSHLYF